MFDELRTKALSTAWNETSNAQDMVDSFLYTPTLLRKYGVLCEEREVFIREYARLAPQRHEGAIHVLHEISPELYEAMLNWLRKGGEFRTDDNSPRQHAMKTLLERGRVLMARDMTAGPTHKACQNLRASLVIFADSIPEYTNSATYRARHSGFYENKADHPTFFFS